MSCTAGVRPHEILLTARVTDGSLGVVRDKWRQKDAQRRNEPRALDR